MDIKRLEHLRQAVEAGSISAAAHRVGLSQPALTKSIRVLEQELGVALLERRARGVVPTACGAALLRRAAPVGVLLADALREIAALRGGPPAEGAIGAGPTWLRGKLPAAIAASLAADPALRIRVQGGYDEPLLRALRAGALDAVLAELPPAEEAADLTLVALEEEDFVVGARRGHPLAGASASPERMLAFPWVLPPRPSRARARLAALFVARGATPPEPALETDSTDMLLRVVAASDALCFQVRSTLAAPDAAAITGLDAPELVATRRTGIVLRHNGWLPPATYAVLARLAEACGAEMPIGYGSEPKT